jgi:hypothetical protein
MGSETAAPNPEREPVTVNVTTATVATTRIDRAIRRVECARAVELALNRAIVDHP